MLTTARSSQSISTPEGGDKFCKGTRNWKNHALDRLKRNNRLLVRFFTSYVQQNCNSILQIKRDLPKQVCNEQELNAPQSTGNATITPLQKVIIWVVHKSIGPPCYEIKSSTSHGDRQSGLSISNSSSCRAHVNSPGRTLWEQRDKPRLPSHTTKNYSPPPWAHFVMQEKELPSSTKINRSV